MISTHRQLLTAMPLLKTLNYCKFSVFKDMSTPRPNGKLSIVATPIGNLSDLTPNILKCLFKADLIGCQDRRVAGQLYTLIKNKNILQKIEQKFGTIGISNLVLSEQKQQQQIPTDQTQKKHQFYQYANMNDKQRRKFLSKLTLQQQKQFKIDYLKYRAKKIINKTQQFLYNSKRQKFDQLYGIQLSDYKHIELQIANTRTKKGRGLLIPLNTYSQTKMFDMIRNMLESKHVAVVSDAGMPCISDPGWRLVKMIRETMPTVPIEVVGGPSAIDIMLTLATATASQNSLSGRFQGFASPQISSITQQNMTINKYMQLAKQKDFSIHFINSKKLKRHAYTLQRIYGQNHRIMLANELTKKYERTFNGNLKQLVQYISKDDDKQFEAKGQMSYLLWSDKSKQLTQESTQQKKEGVEQKDIQQESRVISVNIIHFIKSLKQTELKSKEKAELVSSVFGLKLGKAKKYVYENEQKKPLRPVRRT